MDTQKLALLEKAVEPYRRVGFVITSQSGGAITLVYPREKFSYLFFIFTLLLIWPVAVIYLISYNNQKEKSVCVRITSQGYVEESGYTLKAIEKERRRDRLLMYIAIAVVMLIVIAIIALILYSRLKV